MELQAPCTKKRIINQYVRQWMLNKLGHVEVWYHSGLNKKDAGAVVLFCCFFMIFSITINHNFSLQSNFKVVVVEQQLVLWSLLMGAEIKTFIVSESDYYYRKCRRTIEFLWCYSWALLLFKVFSVYSFYFTCCTSHHLNR